MLSNWFKYKVLIKTLDEKKKIKPKIILRLFLTNKSDLDNLVAFWHALWKYENIKNYLIKKNKKIMKKYFKDWVLASSLSFAQQFGVKAGLNLSDISNTSTAVDTKMKTGLYAGVTATFPITESYSIKPRWCTTKWAQKNRFI